MNVNFYYRCSKLAFAGVTALTLAAISSSDLRAQTVTYASDLQPTYATNGYGPFERDRSNGESAAGDGRTLTLQGKTYTKGLGVHAGSEIRYSVAGRCSNFSAEVGVDDEVGANGSVVFQVLADSVKVYDSGVMNGSTATKPVNVNISGKNQLSLIVTTGGDNYYYDHADWALARVTCTASDTIPPTVTTMSPAASGTGVAASTLVSAAFSEQINPATATAATFFLSKQGTTTPVSASVTYNSGSSILTLDPAADLAPSSTYTVTLKGGSAGIKDVAGNAMAADKVWNFSTAAPTNGMVAIAPGTNIQSVVNANPEGTAFLLKAGTHRMQQVQPKNRNTFTGETGAIMNGSALLTNWVREGSYWVVYNQTQRGATGGECFATSPRCNRPEDLFYDNKPLLHVAALSSVAPGKYFFDYNASKIYMADDPNGHTVETSVTRMAFYGPATGVTISGLIVEKYAVPAQTGAIGDQGPGTNWVVQNNEVRLNHGMGIRIGTGHKVLNNKIHHNGQMGMGGIGNDVLVEGNELAFNNYAGYNDVWEAGGCKFVKTNRLVVRNNYSHDNVGAGLWTDIDNINTLYEGNTVNANTGGGIIHEISYDAIIRNNICKQNGPKVNSWVWGSQIQIQNSQKVEVYGNKVTVASTGGTGIVMVQQTRGTGAYGPYLTINNNVHDNEVTYLGNSGLTGGAADYDGNTLFVNGNNRFDRNKYHAPSLTNATRWCWQNSVRTFDQFRGYGLEINGTADTNVVP